MKFKIKSRHWLRWIVLIFLLIAEILISSTIFYKNNNLHKAGIIILMVTVFLTLYIWMKEGLILNKYSNDLSSAKNTINGYLFKFPLNLCGMYLFDFLLIKNPNVDGMHESNEWFFQKQTDKSLSSALKFHHENSFGIMVISGIVIGCVWFIDASIFEYERIKKLSLFLNYIFSVGCVFLFSILFWFGSSLFIYRFLILKELKS